MTNMIVYVEKISFSYTRLSFKGAQLKSFLFWHHGSWNISFQILLQFDKNLYKKKSLSAKFQIIHSTLFSRIYIYIMQNDLKSGQESHLKFSYFFIIRFIFFQFKCPHVFMLLGLCGAPLIVISHIERNHQISNANNCLWQGYICFVLGLW
jgi:hypothetical protein